MQDKPNIIVYGIGHSGTSIVSKMLHELGWNVGIDVDEYHFEDIPTRELNEDIARNDFNEGHEKEILNLYNEYPKPFSVKDPRFIWTIEYWENVFINNSIQLPFLLWVTRDKQSVMHSHDRRGELSENKKLISYKNTESTYEEYYEFTEQKFNAYSGQKLKLSYEDILAAVSLFKPTTKPDKKTFLRKLF